MFQAVEDSLQDFKLIKMVWKTQCFCILSIFDFSSYVSSIWLTASEARRRAEVLSGGNKRKLSAALALAWMTQECGACPVSFHLFEFQAFEVDGSVCTRHSVLGACSDLSLQ